MSIKHYPDYPEKIAQLNEAIEYRGISIRKLSKLSGLAQTTIIYSLAGKHQFTQTSIDKLTRALGCRWEGATLMVIPKQRRDYVLADSRDLTSEVAA